MVDLSIFVVNVQFKLYKFVAFLNVRWIFVVIIHLEVVIDEVDNYEAITQAIPFQSLGGPSPSAPSPAAFPSFPPAPSSFPGAQQQVSYPTTSRPSPFPSGPPPPSSQPSPMGGGLLPPLPPSTVPSQQQPGFPPLPSSVVPPPPSSRMPTQPVMPPGPQMMPHQQPSAGYPGQPMQHHPSAGLCTLSCDEWRWLGKK